MQRKHLFPLTSNLSPLTFNFLVLLAFFASPAQADRLSRLSEEAWEAYRSEYKGWQLDSLSHAPRFVWHLPDSLEPNADMHFYYGSKGDRPAAGYPFFLYTHGSGPKEDEWRVGLQLCQIFDDAPSAYAIPRIPNEGDWYRWWQRSKQWAWERLLRQELASGDIDPTRIYVFGISEGGYGSQRLASYYADYLAAAGPMAGGEPLRNAPVENLAHVAYSMITGEKDVMFFRNMMTQHVSQQLDSIATLYPGEYKHRVIIQEGRGHGVDYRPTTPWLAQHTRTAQPTHYRWENMEMDGRKRNAFYNLEVLKESDEAYRTYYDYATDATTNTIDLTVEVVAYETTWKDPYWNIPFLFRRILTAAPHGHLRIYLSSTLADLSRPVTVRVNGKEVYRGRPSMKTAHVRTAMAQSLVLWGDPLRIFPTWVEVEW